MAEILDGLHLGSKRVFPVNPDSSEHNTAYKGSEFDGNAIALSKPCMISVNGTEGLKAGGGKPFYIANNYYYQFYEEVLLSQMVVTEPSLGVTQSETSLTDVSLVADTESTAIISMTLNTGSEMPANRGTFEVSFSIQNDTNQNADMTVRIYDDDELAGEDINVPVGKNELLNYFKSSTNSTPVSAASVLTVTVELSSTGIVIAPIDLLVRVGT